MTRRDKETEDYVTPGRVPGQVLYASVIADKPFFLELPEGKVTFGRVAEADVQLGIPSVSRMHVELAVRRGQASVRDLGSRNGTFVDGARLGSESRPLARGDEIAFGSVRVALLEKRVLPQGVRPLLVASSFRSRVDAALATNAEVALVLIRLPMPWRELDATYTFLSTLMPAAMAGIVDERTLAFAFDAREEPPSTAALDAVVIQLGRAKSNFSVASAVALLAAASKDASGKTRTPLPSRGRSAMDALAVEAGRVAPSPVSVLIVGETGTGKEVMARTIHDKSGRRGQLVSVNTAALPDPLVESELFGHERGAFSGAHQTKIGLIEAADGGTLFLDEIGDIPLALQAKLLRVLEDRSVRRVGATVEKKIDVRVVAATHKDLERAVADGTFRRDLLYRLNACVLTIPPLRARLGDLERLATELLGQATAQLAAPRHALTLSRDALALLLEYDWPGNVRELKNVMDRALAMAESDAVTIEPRHLPEHIRASERGPARTTHTTLPPPLPATGDVRDDLKDLERRRILDALDRASGSVAQAAKMLGLPRRTLAYRMSRLGVRTS